jgi:hypothetical protein
MDRKEFGEWAKVLVTPVSLLVAILALVLAIVKEGC